MRPARLTMLTVTMAAALIAGTSQASATTQGASTTQAAIANYYPFHHGRTFARLMVQNLNRQGFSGSYVASVSTYQIVLKGYYQGSRYTSHLHKVGTQLVQIQLYMLGQVQTKVINVGYDV